MTNPSGTHAKRALLIGIDKYPSLNPLDGCVNDVTLMQSVLQDNFGFPEANVRVLTNEQATRNEILAAFDALVEATGQDDIVVLHYAGHGSQMTDREDDEPDGMDETIMPYDSEGRRGVNRDITDDEIHLRLIELGKKTSFTTLIFDSCHSGTITRDGFGVKSRSMEPDDRPIEQLPTSPIPKEFWGRTRDAGPSGWADLANGYVLLAGCRDEQTSHEYKPDGQGAIMHGAMSYFLCQELRRVLPGTTYRDVFEIVAANVNAAFSNQHPQMEGRVDREVLGVADVEPMRFVGVTGRRDDTLTLAAGAAHGMMPGSVWEVYPQGTKKTEGITALGTIEVTAVRATTSDARITTEATPKSIAAGARAVESVHAYGDLRLSVNLSVPAEFEANRKQLRGELEKILLLKVVDKNEPASIRVYLIPRREGATDGDPVPQLGPLYVPTWAAVGQNGKLVMRPRVLEDSADIGPNLQIIARHRHALGLNNPDPGSRLRGKFSLDLLREKQDGPWVIAEPDTPGGYPVFHEGERIGFRVTSRHSAPVYVSALDFGLTGAVFHLYPAPGAAEALQPGGSFEDGTPGGHQEFPLGIPDDYPFEEEPGRMVEGTETIKLIVTTLPADFSFLRQDAVRGVDDESDTPRGDVSPLEMLWQTALAQPTMRDAKTVLRVGSEDWTTVSRSFILRRGSAPAATAGTTRAPGRARVAHAAPVVTSEG